MKKTNYFILTFLTFIFIYLFKLVSLKTIILETCELWLNNIVSSLVPFYILTDLLINYGLIQILNSWLSIISKILNISSSGLFVLIFSMLTGCPSSAKYIASLLKEGLISQAEADYLIRFTHFVNPLFIVNTIGLTVLANKFYGFLILLSHFFSNFIIAFIFRPKNTFKSKYPQIEEKMFSQVLTKSIKETFEATLIILGNLIIFTIVSQMIFSFLGFSGLLKACLNALLEVTSGLFQLKILNLSLNLKAILTSSFISFGGLAIHSQVYSFLSSTKIPYKNYLQGRIIQALLAPLILSLILLIYSI